MADPIVNISKFLSLVLRHQPEIIGLTLDDNGWANVDELIERINSTGRRLDRTLLDRVVAENNKRRFSMSADGLSIRANQGHSIEVDLALKAVEPPEVLYHGTATRFLDSIRASGLHSGSRQHVHLSSDLTTATAVGKRHGRPAVLHINAREMSLAGYLFYLSDNEVWLTERVPAEFIGFPE
ncbi:MAG: RNA 2'-phosphotransferase [Planctomycetaceae bacterium]|nr:RNA 2'-phosphotransferase [Planctomycetaceae bacterium]